MAFFKANSLERGMYGFPSMGLYPKEIISLKNPAAAILVKVFQFFNYYICCFFIKLGFIICFNVYFCPRIKIRSIIYFSSRKMIAGQFTMKNKPDFYISIFFKKSYWINTTNSFCHKILCKSHDSCSLFIN